MVNVNLRLYNLCPNDIPFVNENIYKYNYNNNKLFTFRLRHHKLTMEIKTTQIVYIIINDVTNNNIMNKNQRGKERK